MSDKIGINDRVVEKIEKIDSRVSLTMDKQLKGEKPFASEKINPDTLIWAVNNIGSEDLQELAQEYGIDALKRLRWDVFKLEQRRAK